MKRWLLFIVLLVGAGSFTVSFILKYNYNSTTLGTIGLIISLLLSVAMLLALLNAMGQYDEELDDITN